MSMMFGITPAFQRFVVNKMLPLSSVLDFLGLDYNTHGNMYCPFHDDESHPSAHFYVAEDGTESVWCYAEQKRFFSSNAVTQLARKDIQIVFDRIWVQCPPAQKEYLLSQYDKPIEVLPHNWLQQKDRLTPFVSGKMSYAEYLGTLLKVVTGDDGLYVK